MFTQDERTKWQNLQIPKRDIERAIQYPVTYKAVRTKESITISFVLVNCFRLSSASVNEYTCILDIVSKGPGKQGHIVADTLLPMMFLGLHKLGNICCRHKMFLNTNQKHFFCVRNKCCVRGQTGKHLCQQQCVLVCQGLKTQKRSVVMITMKYTRLVHS